MSPLVEDKCGHAEWLHFMACGACADDLRDRISALETQLAEARAMLKEAVSDEKMLARVNFLARERTKLQTRVADLDSKFHEARAKIELMRTIAKNREQHFNHRFLDIMEILGDEEADSAQGSEG